MVIWKAKVQGKALAELFEKGLADPKPTKSDEIDKHWKLHEDFEEMSSVQFRDDCWEMVQASCREKLCKAFAKLVSKLACCIK